MGDGSRRVEVIAVLAFFCVSLFSFPAFAEMCRDDLVSLRGGAGEARFRVEVADDPEERAVGLMNRETLSPGAGMLFVYPSPQRVGFWMKNTLIPLDMLFIDSTGKVTKVHHEAQPHDENPVLSDDGTIAVLEINGGLARRIGIAEGWTLRHPALDQTQAIWPCADEQ